MKLSQHKTEELHLREPGQSFIRIARDGFCLEMYAPWLAPHCKKKELGFMLRVRDPRARCDHHYAPYWPKQADPHGDWRPSCGNCHRILPVKNGKVIRGKPIQNWRVIKLYVATTVSPRTKPHGVLMLEAATYLTDSRFKRLTTKVFARFKMGFGGPLV